MASWLSGRTLWNTVANVFSRIAETLFFGYICWVSQRWHSHFFATKGVALGLAVTCQPYRCLHTGSCQFSSLGGVPVGKRKNKEIGIRRVREFFHQEKWTEDLFSLSKNISKWKPISTWSFVFSTPGDRLLLRTFKLSLVWSNFSIAKNGPWNKLDSGVKIMKWQLVYTARWCSTNH